MNAQIEYRLSEAGRKAAILAGGDGAEVQTVIVTPDDPQFRRAVEVGRVGNDAVYVYLQGRYVEGAIPPQDEPRTAEWLLNAREETLAAEKAAKEAEAAMAREETLATLRERRTSRALAAELAERKAWAETHGSLRLRRMLTEGIECEAVYLDERLGAERPGWAYYADVPGRYSEPRNPPLEAFDLLDEARKVDPACRLVYVARQEIDDMGENEPGYACVGQFLGNAVVYGWPEFEPVSRY